MNDEPFPTSLCRRCRWLREVRSGRGSVFLMCGQAVQTGQGAKYPPQPVAHCDWFQPASPDTATLSDPAT